MGAQRTSLKLARVIRIHKLKVAKASFHSFELTVSNMLQPKKMKHRKWHKGRSKGVESRGTKLSFGSFGLQSLETKWITNAQIEACRKVMLKTLKKKGKLWIRIFPQKPITSKGGEVGMGGGKGAVSYYVFPIKPGRVIFEVDGIGEDLALEAFKKASNKLPVKTRIIKHISH